MTLPATFGKYYLTEKIATGGMAEIYRGKLFGPGGFEKVLVIKQIHPSLASRREFVQMFVTEAKTTVSLSHGNIVSVYELGVVDGTYFIAMEFVDGVTLTELMRAARHHRRRLDPQLAAFIAAEVLKGLDYAHRKEAGVIHRDLSSRNVMVSREGEVKILDFGLSATRETAAAASRLTSKGGRPVGSFPYMSPEQVRREPLDARSDLFTCGILLWELLAGRPLFARHDEDETLQAVLEQPIVPPSQYAPDVPRELDEVTLKALARDLDKRYASANQFLRGLSRYLYSVEPGVTPETLSRLVSELCPDVPRKEERPPEYCTPRQETAQEASPDRTRPMSRPPAAREEKSFATNAAFAELVEKNLTPLMPLKAITDEDAARAKAAREGEAEERRAAPVDAPAVTAHAPKAASPGRSRWPARVAAGAGLLSILAVLGVVLFREAPEPEARPAQDPDAGAAAAVVRPPAADAAPMVKVDPPDAGGRASPKPDGAAVKPPPAVGTLVVGSTVHATVYLDGRRLGTTPIKKEVPAGKHRVRVVCPPGVCPVDDSVREQVVHVVANDTTTVRLPFD